MSLLLVSAANLATPILIGRAIDDGVSKRSLDVIFLIVGALVGLALVRGLFTFLQGYLAERASQGVAYDLRDALFERIERLSFSYYDRVQTGQLVTRLTSDVEQIRSFAGSGVVQLANAVVMLVGTTVLLLYLDWQLALVALAIVPVIALLLVRFISSIRPLFREVQQTLGQLNTVLQEDLAGVRVIRAFAREDYETGRYKSVNDELLDKNLTTVRVFSNNFPFVFLFANLGTLAIIWFGGWQVIGGRLSIGELVAFNTLLGFMLFPILTLGFLSASISRAGASSQRVFDVLDAPLDVTDAPDASPLPPVSCLVEFDEVSFRYPGSEREVFGEVSFRSQARTDGRHPGDHGFGQVHPRQSHPALLRRYRWSRKARRPRRARRDALIAPLPDRDSPAGDAPLLGHSAGITWPSENPTRPTKRSWPRPRRPRPTGLSGGSPDGYDTVVGERGIGLSGGQRQRIAIARALLIDPRLLILDDSTSAVDAETEAAIQETLDRLMRERHRTVFVIAQRVSTVRDADLILVLDEGRIAARGTHEELLEGSELYNEILGSQLLSPTDAAA